MLPWEVLSWAPGGSSFMISTTVYRMSHIPNSRCPSLSNSGLSSRGELFHAYPLDPPSSCFPSFRVRSVLPLHAYASGPSFIHAPDPSARTFVQHLAKRLAHYPKGGYLIASPPLICIFICDLSISCRRCPTGVSQDPDDSRKNYCDSELTLTSNHVSLQPASTQCRHLEKFEVLSM